ncbi:potassium channel family protein [Microbacterium yannicii]|uniref:potassium channel family protein n=1 Tax=Microbacterium yannicii TaxID=671622 RepID=UPI00030B53AC|nr:potassium channel family protein [Microbacterium yannicii]
MDERAWHQHTRTLLMIASLLYLVAYSWRVIGDLTGPARIVASAVIAVTWALFIADYLVRLLLAEQKWTWFRTHLSALAFALVPVLRLVRLLRVLTSMPGLRRSAGGVLRNQILVYGIGSALVLIYICSLAVLEVERHAPDANITTFGIAIWWACVTVTTTGYGDYFPVTDSGRWVSVGLMFGGVALAGIITATLASWVVERAGRGHDDEQPATRAQIRELTARLEALTSGGPGTPKGDGSGTGLGDGGDRRPGG